MATPFVQGQLRVEDISVEIETTCGHCGTPIHIEVDGQLIAHVLEAGCRPLVFEPDVDWSTFAESTIINAY